MSEQEVRNRLADLIADEPPLTFDPDALMTGADAANRRRRTLVAAGSATLAIAAAAVTVPIVLRAGEKPEQATPASRGTVAVTTPTDVLTTGPRADITWPPAHVVVPDYTAADIEAVAHRLQHDSFDAFRRAVPEASGVDVDLFAGEATGDYHAGQLSLNGAVHYRTDLGNAAVEIQVDAGAKAPAPASVCSQKASAHCKIVPQDDGSAIVVTNWSDGDYLAQTVRQYRLDGVVVAVTGYNADMFGAQPTPYLKKIPVSTTELTRIATTKALTM